MAFATSSDVVQAIRRDLTSTEEIYVETLLDEATDLLVGYLGQDPTASGVVPGAVTRVCARMVARVLLQSGQQVGVTQTQDTAGPFMRGLSYTSGSTSGSPWIAASDKQILKPYRLNGGMRSIGFNSERDYDTVVTDDDDDA